MMVALILYIMGKQVERYNHSMVGINMMINQLEAIEQCEFSLMACLDIDRVLVDHLSTWQYVYDKLGISNMSHLVV